MSDNTQVTLSRAEKIAKRIATLQATIEKASTEVTELTNEYNNLAALESITDGVLLAVKIGRAETTKVVIGRVAGVKVEEDGSKKFKVVYGTGFDADFAVVGSAGIVKVLADGETFDVEAATAAILAALPKKAEPTQPA